MEAYINSRYPNLYLRHSESTLGRILCTRSAIEPFTTILTEPPILSGCASCSEAEECMLCGHCQCLCSCSAAAKKKQSASISATAYLKKTLYDLIPSLLEDAVDSDTSDVIQVQSIKMFIKYLLMGNDIESKDLACVEDLHYQTAQTTDNLLDSMSEQLYAKLPAPLKQKFPVSLIKELLYRFKSNNFCLDDHGHCAVLCPIISMCNHSCSPNCLINIYHGRLHLRSTTRIEASQPITVAYVGAGGAMHIPFFHRQLLMQQRWAFRCNCSRCNSACDFSRVFSCCDCDDGYAYASRDDACPGDPTQSDGRAAATPPNSAVPPVTPPDSEIGTAAWQCVRCKKFIPADARPAYLTAEQNLYHLLHKNDNQAQEGEDSEGMSPLIHTAHYLATEVLMAQLNYEQSIGTDLAQMEALLQQLLLNEQLMFAHPTINSINYHKQLAEMYAKTGDTGHALQEHESAYDEICKLKGEDSPDVHSVQQFMESFLMTYRPNGESAAQLCGAWASNRAKADTRRKSSVSGAKSGGGGGGKSSGSTSSASASTGKRDKKAELRNNRT